MTWTVPGAAMLTRKWDIGGERHIELAKDYARAGSHEAGND